MNSTLNPEQQEAVEHKEGPLLIIAGAGTGKTTVIVEKIKHLIATNTVKPEEILALTFTEKAAQEMEERVDQAMPYGYFQMWIATFHSFADQILRDEISHIGLNSGYKLFTEAESISFVKRHLFVFNLHYFRPLGNPTKFIDALLQHFSRLRDEDISPEQYTQWVATLSTDAIDPSTNKTYTEEEVAKFKELADAYETYQKLKIQEGYFDFSDLIYYVLQLFRTRPTILNRYKKQFKYVLVDEFQDTNISQYLMLKLLAPPDSTESSLTVVGDDSQAIYKFRGASVSNILQFMKDYSHAKSITLIRNYRSNQTILDASYTLIKHNDPDTLEAQLGISKKLIATDKHQKKDTIITHISDTGEGEGDYVVDQILSLTKSGMEFSDIAILVRANKHAEPFTAALGRNSIPYRFWGPGMLFKQPEIKDLIAYLKILADIEDSSSFYRILSMDMFGMDEHDVNLLIGFAKKTALPLMSAAEVYTSFFLNKTDEKLQATDSWYLPEYENYRKYLPLLSEKTRVSLVTLISQIRRHMKLVKKQSAGQILYYFLEDTGYLKKISNPTTAAEEKKAINISKFFTRLKNFESEHEDGSVYAVIEFIQMSMDLGESPSAAGNDVAEYDAVNILTVHGAKGLEFPVVFLVNLSHGRFPANQKREPIPIPDSLVKEIMPQGDYHILEERRLFYVALTRAKEKVYLTASRRYGDGKRERKISGFVAETVGDAEVKKLLSIKQEEKQQLSIFDFRPISPAGAEKAGAPIKPLPLSQFSYSQLESYELCALRYKYQYLLKIPTSPSSAASFGDSIHRSLQKFYMDYLADPMVNLDNLLEAYKQNWIPLGYASKAHENRMRREGEKMLTKFYTTFHAPHTPPNAPFPLISPLSLEKLFKIKVDDTVYVTGKIDRIDKNANGEIEIIDYKTGKKPAEKELKKSLQLSIYALAATDKGLLNVPVDKVTLTFYYLQDMEKTSMKRTAEELIEVKQTIRSMADKIRTGDFKPHIGVWCDFCPFRMVCDAWQ